MDKVTPPSHLSDLKLVQLMETHGRERRWRYFTFASYREIIANENLDDQDGPYSSVDLSNIGNFAPFVAEDFYSDVAELNRLTDYAFSKTGKVEDVEEEAAFKHGKVATPTLGNSGLTVRGKKRKRGEAGLDVDADGEVSRTPRKRGRPRKYPAESQRGDADAARKVTPRTSDNGDRQQSLGEGLEATQQGGTGTANDRHPASPSPGVLRKRRRPPDDGVSPEASMAPRRRGRPRKRPPSPAPVDETADHLLPQDNVYPSNIHEALRPISEQQQQQPNANAKEAETQPTLRESDIIPQHTSHAELSTQLEHTSSVPPACYSLGTPGMAIGIHNAAQLAITRPVPTQGSMETVRDPETGGSAIIQMDTSDTSVLVDHTLGSASSQLQGSFESTEVKRADSVLGKAFQVGEFEATCL